MKSILLTTTAIVAFAGAAAADGHVTMSWSGTATAGIAREGKVDEGTIAGVTASDIGTFTETTTSVSGDAVTAANDAVAAAEAKVTGDFDTYAEVNATVTGSVATDNGLTLSASMSVDAGTGYDFADDDGFDAAKTNGVALDSVTIDAGAMGALTIDKNDIAHLVDDDDDANGDIKYTNNLGIASVEVVMDLKKDTDVVAAREVTGFTLGTTAPSSGDVSAPVGTTQYITYVAADVMAAVAADVAWSAKVSAPVADIATVYAAFDEEGGNAVGGSVTMQGVTITVDSKLEALEEELSEDRSNTIGASYTAGALTVGGSYNTIEDGNQWSINGAYAADGFSVAYSTNEGEEWSATASYAMSDNASIEAGVNYTEDAFVGVSFSF